MDYHSRLEWLNQVIDAGYLGNVDRAGIFVGRDKAPWQILLRDRDTLVVRLCNLHEDGIIEDRGQKFPRIGLAA